MKSSKLLLIASLAMMSLVACEKEEISPINGDENNDTVPTANERRTTYLGTYDMVYTYDSVGVDGNWFVNGFAGQNYEDDLGFLVITADPNDTASVKIDGYKVYADENGVMNDTVLFYDSRATFDGQGQLIPVQCSYSVNGYTYTSTLGPVVLNETGFTMRIEEHLPFAGMDCGYLINAIGTKR